MTELEDVFYTKAKHYWKDIPATVDGMLGGYGHISQTDIHGSRLFLKQLFQSREPPGKDMALDCGAGIGRITKDLLCPFFETVDLVEQNPNFIEQAKEYLQPQIAKIGRYYSVGLQSFEPEANRYDVIWIQWVLGHLTDEDFVTFFKLCKSSLKPNGLIIVKENVTSSDKIEVDQQDSSVTRPYKQLIDLLKAAGLSCYKTQKQMHFPKEVYKVYMIALRPYKESNHKIVEEISNTTSSSAV